MRWHRPLLGALTIGGAAASSPRGGGGANSFSPIKELAPSLAASVAGGTIVAARAPPRQSLPRKNEAVVEGGGELDDEEECVVVLFRSPGEAGSSTQRAAVANLTVASVFGCHNSDDSLHDDTADDTQQRNPHRGLTFLPNGPVAFPFLPGASQPTLRILHAPTGLLLAATGFAPDADHLLQIAAGRVLARSSVFDAPAPASPTGGKGVDPHRLVREDLSAAMIDAAMAEGARPLGVQLLAVGASALPSRKGALEVYTVDPSGGWRSCGGAGGAVGRGAEGARSALHACIGRKDDGGSLEETETMYGWRGALQRAMMSAIDALEGGDASVDNADVPRDEMAANYGAIVVFGRPERTRRQASPSRCAAIDPTIVKEVYRECSRAAKGRRLAE
ncbi:hypothetical protein ACHAXT_004109 [Thalassiosira profunda]